jgi:WD40 repeat protein
VTRPSAPVRPAIQDYELLRPIGRGAYGDVWLARGVTGVLRAVKIVWRDRFDDDRPYEREFQGLRQFAAVSILEPRQLALLHVGRNEAAGFFYYVMELADDIDTGREINPERYVPNTLKEMRERRGRISAPETITIGVELARGLATLHKQRLVHRDIKPSNVIFVGGAPKLADIGLVTVASSGDSFVGTAGFVPPEGSGTPTADVYSLGKLLYELATGMDRNDYPRLPPELTTFPDSQDLLELNEVLLRACDNNRDKRYPDASALLDELLLVLAGKSIRRLRSTERRLTRATRVGAVLACAAAIASAGAWVERRRAEDEFSQRQDAENDRRRIAAEAQEWRRWSAYAGDLSSAQRALQSEDRESAQRYLARADTSLRGVEWQALQHDAREPVTRILTNGVNDVVEILVAPDGERLLARDSGGGRRSLSVHNLRTGEVEPIAEEVRTLLRWEPESGSAVYQGTNDAIFRWDATTRQTASLGTLHGWAGWLSPSGSEACVSWNTPGMFPAWYEREGGQWRKTWQLAAPPEAISYGLAVDERTRTVAFGWREGTDRVGGARELWVGDVSGTQYRWRMALPALAWSITFNAAQSGIFVGLYNGEILLLDARTGALRWRVSPHKDIVERLVPSPDGRLLAAISEHELTVLDTVTGNRVRRWPRSGLRTCAWYGERDELVAGDSRGRIFFWRPMANTEGMVVAGLVADPAATVTFGRSSLKVAASSVPTEGQGAIEVFNWSDPRNRLRLVGPDQPIGFANDDRWLVAARGISQLELWDVALGRQLASEAVSMIPGSSTTRELSPDGHLLVCSTTSNPVTMYSVPEFRPISFDSPPLSEVNCFGWSPDSTLCLSGHQNGRAYVWDIAAKTGRQLAHGSKPVSAVASSANGRWVAVAYEGLVEIHDLASGRLIHEWEPPGAHVLAMRFTTDDSRLITAGSGGLLQFRETKNWSEAATLQVSESEVGTGSLNIDRIALSQDEEYLAVHLRNGSIRRWLLR